MSLLPLILNELDVLRRPSHLWNELDVLRRPSHLCDQHFGDALRSDDLLAPFHSVAMPLLSNHYARPWRVRHQKHSGVSHIVDERDTFKINLDVKQFKPEELSVKVADGFVVVEGNHEERQDEHGFVSRQFSRRYKLPDNVDPDVVTSSLSSDGVLMVSAPKKALPAPENQRPVPIVQTQKPAIQLEEKKDDKMEQ